MALTLGGILAMRSQSIVLLGVVAAVVAAAAPVSLSDPIVVDLAAQQPVFRLEDDRVQSSFGGELGSCDFDGDGVEDLFTTAAAGSGVDGMRPQAGEAYITLGRRRAWNGSFPLRDFFSTRVIGEEEFDRLGEGGVCADFDGDGRGDLVLGAPQADGIANAVFDSGQLHIIFGTPSPPPLIDLLAGGSTNVYGAEPGDFCCQEPSFGDFNGDGQVDLFIDARSATSRNGLQTKAGKMHLSFGRANWPATVDLRTQADVTIFGNSQNDSLAASTTAGDLNGDGIDDVVGDAPGGDGPGNARSSAGDVLVFRGRTSWPSIIDLAVSSPDMTIYGADAGDAFGRAGMWVADLDVDGTSELMIGGPFADGPSNGTPSQGEARSVEPGSTWPSTIDLRVTTRTVVYGPEANDEYANRLTAGDVNGDGIPDLVATASQGDGPGNGRTNCGETYVVLGRPGLPADIRLANGEYDILIYGDTANYLSTVARSLTDINDDGLQEIALRDGSSTLQIPSVVLVSPFDVDGDGYQQLEDNCPLVANPSQADFDGDRRGDACASDWDGDGQDDALDCAPSRAADGTPEAVASVAWHPGSTTTLRWSTAAFANRYDVTRGSVLGLASSDFGTCQNVRDADLADTQFVDGEVPLPQQAYVYLVRGRNDGCAVAGSWGQGSAGGERINVNPAGCP